MRKQEFLNLKNRGQFYWENTLYTVYCLGGHPSALMIGNEYIGTMVIGQTGFEVTRFVGGIRLTSELIPFSELVQFNGN